MAYLTELTDYVSDTFFLRRELITGYAGLKALFGQSADEDVVTGRDGWLFYGDEMADYAGSEPLTEREVFAAANNLSLMQEYVEGEGAEFLFFIAPNKSSLYPEYLQGYPAAQTERNAERLMKELTERQVAYTDLSEVFLSEEILLYFAHDSHWTSRGAALAADQALAAVGRESAYFDGIFPVRSRIREICMRCFSLRPQTRKRIRRLRGWNFRSRRERGRTALRSRRQAERAVLF